MARIREQPRKNARLPGYDYSLPGAYFITIVSKHRETLFDDRLLKSVVDRSWRWLGVRYEHVEIDAFVVMPNHLHGIVIISVVGARFPRPSVPSHATIQGAETAPLRQPTLGQIVACFKYQTAKRINLHRATPGMPVWRRNYYEHVIRDDEDLDRIRQYIQNNPAQWHLDAENPENNVAKSRSRLARS